MKIRANLSLHNVNCTFLQSPWKSKVAVDFKNVPLFTSDETLLHKGSFAPEAYGSSQARGRIGAAPASLQHSPSNMGVCDLYCSAWQSWILNPLSKARD